MPCLLQGVCGIHIKPLVASVYIKAQLPPNTVLFGVDKGHNVALQSDEVQYNLNSNVLDLSANVPPTAAKTVLPLTLSLIFS